MDDDKVAMAMAKKKKGHKTPLWVWLAAGFAGLFLLCGCGGVVTYFGYSKMGGAGLFGPTITMNNFKKLKRGMTEDDVKKILGTPARRVVLVGYPNVVWEDRAGGDYITVIFSLDGKSQQAHYQITQGGEVLKDFVDLH